jgi:hypothetical protein
MRQIEDFSCGYYGGREPEVYGEWWFMYESV